MEEASGGKYIDGSQDWDRSKHLQVLQKAERYIMIHSGHLNRGSTFKGNCSVEHLGKLCQDCCPPMVPLTTLEKVPCFRACGQA